MICHGPFRLDLSILVLNAVRSIVEPVSFDCFRVSAVGLRTVVLTLRYRQLRDRRPTNLDRVVYLIVTVVSIHVVAYEVVGGSFELREGRLVSRRLSVLRLGRVLEFLLARAVDVC